MRVDTRHLFVAALLSLALAGCGGDEGTDDDLTTDEVAQDETDAADEAETDEADTETTDDDADADADADAATGEVTVSTASVDLGEILVDGEGMSLYMFDPDEQGPSTCYDDCAANWPPLTTEGEPAADGEADAGLLGTVERDDGTLQVTYDGWPLYFWAADEAAGDVTGQAVGDVWWVLDPAGTPIREGGGDEEAAATADDRPASRPGY